ncbi:MAG: polymerase sigma factor [Verrucomicrobiales bacterium]|nr:polymerase sigma factor [Verrucomicrobiales bacterium]
MGNSERASRVFATTCWTEVFSAPPDSAPARGEALARLCAAYWPPLYAFLRCDGCNPEEAEDLVQGFFEQFIAGDYLRDVSRNKGRFRSFMLGCLKHYAANVRRELRTQRRGGSRPHLALLDPEALEQCAAALMANPPDDSFFDRVWAETIMHKSLARVRREYSAAGKATIFDRLSRCQVVCTREFAVHRLFPFSENWKISITIASLPTALEFALYLLRRSDAGNCWIN